MERKINRGEEGVKVELMRLSSDEGRWDAGTPKGLYVGPVAGSRVSLKSNQEACIKQLGLFAATVTSNPLTTPIFTLMCCNNKFSNSGHVIHPPEINKRTKVDVHRASHSYRLLTKTSFTKLQ